MQIVDQIVMQFSPIIGLKVSIARNAGTMKVFHFGEPRPHKWWDNGAFCAPCSMSMEDRQP